MAAPAAPNPLLSHAGMDHPIICGPMYPCSNPELIAAASRAGAMGVIQPISLTYAHGYALRDGIRLIHSLTSSPVGFNALIEGSSRYYLRRMEAWLDIALDEGIRFVITSLGKPDWVVRRVHDAGGVVYHDASTLKWARKGADAGVDGLICVNNRAGGHTGRYSAHELYAQFAGLGLPLVCAGGVATAADVREVMGMGYHGVQLGTAFIATDECTASMSYKQAIVHAQESDIGLTLKLSGVPVSVIGGDEPRTGASGFIGRVLGRTRARRAVRVFLMLRGMRRLRRSLDSDVPGPGGWQAGRSAAGVTAIRPVSELVADLAGGAIPRGSG